MLSNAGFDAFLEEAAAFADREIRPFAAQFEEDKGVPPALIAKMAERGYLGAPLPLAYGGLQLDPVQYGLLTEQIGKACCSTRSILTVHTSLVGETILRFGTEEQKAYWLPRVASGKKIGAFALSEPEAGSDAKSVRTAYLRDGNGFVINGNKKWISLGHIADFFIVLAAGNGKLTAFLVDRQEGVTSTPMKGLLGNRAAHTAEVTFSGVRVGQEHVLGKEGNGFTHVVNTALDYGRFSIAWAGLAIAQEALEAVVRYARVRAQFGQKLYQFQSIQHMIADAVTQVHAARRLCVHAAHLRKAQHPEAATETIIAKYYASQAAMRVTTDAVQVHGGNGCHSAYPVERLFREAKILEIIEGTSQVLQPVIAAYGLKTYFTPKANG